MENFINEFKEIVESAATRLLQMSESQSEIRPAPGKWSPKEIIGHLIDSAANNHRRFVLAQLQDDLIFPGYKQDKWVAAQNYQSASWASLVQLWKLYNLQIAHLVSCIPEETLLKPRRNHNLHEIAWQTVPPDQPAALDYFIRDYFGHLQHHLRQIFKSAKLKLDIFYFPCYVSRTIHAAPGICQGNFWRVGWCPEEWR